MVAKLSRAGDAAGATTAAPKGWGNKAVAGPSPGEAAADRLADAPEQAAPRPSPTGWGKKANPAVETTAERENPGAETQGERIQAKLDGDPQGEASQQGAFSSNVDELRQALHAEAGGDPPFTPDVPSQTAEPKATRARTKDVSPPASGLSLQDIKDAVALALAQRPVASYEPTAEEMADMTARNDRYELSQAAGTLESLAKSYKDALAATAQLAEVDEPGAVARLTVFLDIIDGMLAEI